MTSEGTQHDNPEERETRETRETREAQKKTFREYMSDLALTEDDVRKRILDVGGGSGAFAAWVQEHHEGSDITVLDPFLGTNEHEPAYPDMPPLEALEGVKWVRARSDKIPFPAEEFELTLSHSSIPHVFAGARYTESQRHELIQKSLHEMLRVTQSGGEVRIGPMIEGTLYTFHRNLKKRLDEVVGELEKEGFLVEYIPLGKIPIRYDPDGNPLEKEPAWCIRIQKPHKG